MTSLILLVTYDDNTQSFSNCSSLEEATSRIEDLKKNSAVETIELINATTVASWDYSTVFESWIDETEL